jgi:hypothetical protein
LKTTSDLAMDGRGSRGQPIEAMDAVAVIARWNARAVIARCKPCGLGMECAGCGLGGMETLERWKKRER